MRCLTLAGALRKQGAECHFICKNHSGHLIQQVREAGHIVHEIPVEDNAIAEINGLGHSSWLGSTQTRDAQASLLILNTLIPTWIVVDHYAIDRAWEEEIKPLCQKLIVIDDLADREHCCDVVIDQNLGRQANDYRELVPDNCKILAGPKYTLLRQEFSELRKYSLQRRARPSLQHIIINMGGVDKDNATGRVLSALQHCTLPKNCRVTVIMGARAPWVESIRLQALSMSHLIDIKVNVTNMAALMAECDLVIGAAGSTSWERCCLGVPTLMVILASNQVESARALEKQGAAVILTLESEFDYLLNSYLKSVINDGSVLTNMIGCASRITDGSGCRRVVEALL
ncbi:UDP-2,4-diacetamido-2,4,6-trideoxy-beta-L-altropyranose hydrolase [Pseudomonas sp. MS19]|uniref:UDP-2,4-diacetamido-2,4, 6-trideoxy-beta-L-altropyranose hydrolase n=1 Tax=Pseudomonas sp. MS19 TaxID=2579939 RepID=UPI001F5B3E51|nr:UDP-2,4-diacetamido-2,4,6-trideoxy-beta-L-altropyranose hydrolase [Pseudomonas sp. MS19]